MSESKDNVVQLGGNRINQNTVNGLRMALDLAEKGEIQDVVVCANGINYPGFLFHCISEDKIAGFAMIGLMDCTAGFLRISLMQKFGFQTVKSDT